MKKLVMALMTMFVLQGVSHADTFYSWRYREHATDCTSLTDGKLRDFCYEIDADTFYKCEPTAGDCSGAEWRPLNTTGLAGTSTALAANGANASAGSAILGVDASGAAEGAFDVWTEAENTSAAYISATSIDTSAELDTIVTDDTGSGALVFANTPTLVTPVIGAATGTSLNVSGSVTAGTTSIGTSSISTAICDMTNGGATLWDCPATSQGVTGERASGTFARTNSSTGWAVGVRGTANKTGAGSSHSSQAGVEGVVSLTGTSGTDTWAYGVRGKGTINGAGYTLTNFAGIYGEKMTETAGTLTNNYAGYFNGVVAVENGATSAGKFRLLEDSDDGSNYTEFTVPAMAGNIAYTLPPDDGDAGEQLQTDGSGVLTWEAAGAGSGDSISIDGVAVVDPNFASAGGDIDFVDTANVVTANINWTTIGNAEIERAKLNWSTFWTDATSGINWGSVPGATTDYVLKRTASGINWQASTGGAETNSLETLTTGIATTEIPIGTAADTVVYAALSGDVTMTNGGVVSIGNDKVVEADLKAVDAASDEECLTYETTTGDFEWQSCGAGGSGATDINLPIYSAKLTGTFVTDQDATQGAQIDAGDGNWRLLFDATTDEGAVWQFVMPSNYASTPTLDIDFSMTSGEANEVEFEGAIMCYTAGTDTADVATASFSAIAVGTATTVSATAGEVYRQSITLTDDSCAAGDMVWIYLSTDADDATNDDATGDREVVGVNFNYA